MPALTGTPVIRHAWRPRAEPGRIHYIANGGGDDRHLVATAGTPLYDVLAEALDGLGYSGSSYPGRLALLPPVEPSRTA